MGDAPLVLIALVVLAACAFYTYAGVFLAPHPGFTLDGNWVVQTMDACDTSLDWCRENQARLHVGDRFISIGNLNFAEYRDNYLAVPFDGYKPGDNVPITIGDPGNARIIYWHMPPERSTLQFESAFSLWLFLPFWLAGTVALLFLRPRDEHWRALITFYYVIAVWLATGFFSTSGVAGITVVYKVTSWLFLPVFVSLHAQIPAPLVGSRLRSIVTFLYLVTAIFIVLDFSVLLPGSSSLVSIIIATLGSLGLLIYRQLARPTASVRLAASLMLAGIGLSFLPGILTWAIPALLGLRVAQGLTIVFFAVTIPALPLFYSYATYKRGLGALEFRANRLLSAYSFALIYLTAFVLVLFIASYLFNLPADDISSVPMLAIAAAFIVAAPFVYLRFQRLVNWVAYGSRHNPEEILRVLASRIPAARDRESLVQILADEMAPSLLIRQSALFLLDKSGADGLAVYARDLTEDELKVTGTSAQLQKLLADPKRYRLPAFEATTTSATEWVRLVIPIQIQENLLGVWLLGRRDPDDFYPQPDISLLTAIASQIAPAIENMRLYDSLRQQADELASLYRASGGLLNPGAGLKRLAEEIANTITREFAVADCGVMIVDDAQAELKRVARTGTFPVTTNAPLPLDGPGLSVAAYRWGDVIYAPDVAADPRYLGNNLATRSELVIPLKAGQGVIGVLDLQSPDLDAFNERTRRILITFAERAALALENARLLENLTRARRLAEEASQLKSEFLANTSHELRTPLAGILGSLSLVLDGMCETPAEEREFVATAHNSARNLLHVVNDILDIAKLEAGRMEFMMQPVHVNMALAEVQSLTRSQAEAKRLALEFVLAADDPITLADHDRLRQILLNLVGNSIKFTERGLVTVRAATDDHQVWISVQDTGIGIAPEKQAKLFQPFVQADGSSTRRYGGTGLGLSISQRLANILGGTLTFYSAGEGQGSTFTLTLPLAPADEQSTSDHIPVPVIAEPTHR